MIRTALAASVLLMAGATPTLADSAPAYCSVSVHDHTVLPTPLEPCTFSQYQGNVYIRTADRRDYQFLEKDAGTTHDRFAHKHGISYMEYGKQTVNVIWPHPGIQCTGKTIEGRIYKAPGADELPPRVTQ